MKPETIKNHRMLWDGIIAYLETKSIDEIREDVQTKCFNIVLIKYYIFKKIFGDIYILNHCFLCQENYSNNERLMLLTCKCPLLKYHSCRLFDKLVISYESDYIKGKITKKTLRIAKRIRYAV